MKQNNLNLNSWKKKKTEAEKAVKNLERKREKTLYLYHIEKQSRGRTKRVQLQTLLDYETKELQKAQAELDALSSRIAQQEKEEQKYKAIKLMSIAVLIIVSMGILSVNLWASAKKTDPANHPDSLSGSISTQGRWLTILSQRFFTFIEKYSSRNDLLTGAVIAAEPSAEQIESGENCSNSTICTNETVEKIIKDGAGELEVQPIKEEIPETPTENESEQKNFTTGHEPIPIVPPENFSKDIPENISNSTQQEIYPKKVVDNITTKNLQTEINPRDLSPLADLNIVTNGRFEDVNVDLSIPRWITGGDSRWSATAFTVFEGSYAAQATSGSMADNGLTWFNTTVNITQSATLTFYWKVSSESGFDFLLFCNSTISCTRTTGYIDRISGTVDWTKQSYTLPIGTQVLHWAYAKDVSGSFGSDEGWLDNVSIVNNCPPSGSSNGNFETGDLSSWNTGGDKNWFVQNPVRQEGCFAGRAGTIDSNNVTWINTTVTLAHPANLSFSWKVDSESGFDFLSFCNSTVSCTRTSGYLDQISGSQDWATKTYTLPVGTQVLHWAYAKDGSVNTSSDTGWLDNVTILNNHPVIINWSLNTTDPLTNNTNTNLTAYINASDSEGDSLKFIYNWFVNGTSIAVLNMPFEEFNGTLGNNTKDYSGFGNNGSENGVLYWNATGGHDGWGAYMFNESGDFINTHTIAVNASRNGLTITAWIKPASLDVIRHVVVKEGSYRAGVNGNDLHFNFWNSTNDFGSVTSSGSLLQTGWNFVSYVVLPNSTVQLYLNGSIIGTGQIIGSMNVSIDPVTISMSTSSFWNGTIDDVIIFNRSLSDEQIKALWLNQTNILVANETVAGDNWTVQVTPNDGTGDGNITTTNTVTIKNAPPLITSLVLNTTNVSSNQTDVNLTAYTFTSDADGDSIKVIYNWLVNGRSITVLNMPFEGINGSLGNNAWDYSGSGNNGSVTSAFWNATGGYDGKGAYKFNQTNTRIDIPNSGSLNFTNLSFSISFWVNRESVQNTGFGTIINKGGAAGLKIYILIQSSGTLWRWDQFNSGYTMPANQWHHVVYTFNVFNDTNGTERFYVDGSLQATRANATIYASDDQSVLSIGSAAGSHPFNGTIDELMIFNRSLSAEQVAALYRNQTNIITASETIARQNWTVQATPNDGYNDGGVNSSNLTILNAKPRISTLILNSTDLSTNSTDTNVTAYAVTSDADGDSVKVIYNWLRNGTSITMLNMPFEGINGSLGNNAWDYSGYGHNGSVNGPVWNATGGYDSKGAYVFDGISNYIDLLNPPNYPDVFTITIRSFSIQSTTQTVHFFDIPVGAGNNKIYSQSQSQLAVRIKGTTQAFATSNRFNKWVSLTIVRNSSNDVVLYEDAVLNSAVFNMPGPFNFSRIGNNAAGSFNGTLDDIVIYNRSLSATQVKALYNNRTDLIAAQETTIGENWIVQAYPNDNYEDGTVVTSNNVTIKNVVPSIPLLMSPNGTTTTSRTPTFIWNNSVDSDGDPNISYRLEVDDNRAFTNTEVNVSGILNSTATNTSYTITTELNVDTTYFWRVFAYDQTAYSENSSVYNFTVQSYLAINTTSDLVAFGTLNNGANVSTPGNATPFRAENVGNIVANVTVTATPFFSAVTFPSVFYQFKIRENETGSFNTSVSYVNWTYMNSSPSPVHVVNLDWHSVSNDFITDLNISVPGNESAGVKSSNVTFTIEG